MNCMFHGPGHMSAGARKGARAKSPPEIHGAGRQTRSSKAARRCIQKESGEEARKPCPWTGAIGRHACCKSQFSYAHHPSRGGRKTRAARRRKRGISPEANCRLKRRPREMIVRVDVVSASHLHRPSPSALVGAANHGASLPRPLARPYTGAEYWKPKLLMRER
ncbi:hypothetical protein BS50DRAFT_240879 [Corynespora cassiicola Philippines]|uniref:Uncharacterized protein n=1 Tax=Corynespora cassiicola Philippines TaxID=1448308 RepID=A0A2T2P302_CORCC|nr:hypothetical protein BS50DRAFT_240879 [Corynespora cassiicola Philippines]